MKRTLPSKVSVKVSLLVLVAYFIGLPLMAESLRWNTEVDPVAQYPGSSIMVDGEGGYYVGHSTGSDTSKSLVLNRYSVNGQKVWNTDTIIAGPSSISVDEFGQNVCSDGNGGVFCIWGEGPSTDCNAYVQKVFSDGTIAWPAKVTISATVGSNQLPVAVEPDGMGGAYIVWRDEESGAYRIKVQRIDANGMFQWSSARVFTAEYKYQSGMHT
jgi:hypothetical protein